LTKVDQGLEASVSNKNIRITPSSDDGLISSLVYSALNTTKEHLLRPANPEWIEEAGNLLVRQCLDSTFDQKTVLQELMELGFKYDTIVDYCISLAATKLGESWVNDTLSFAETTVGSANLQKLLKLIAEDRQINFNSSNGKRFLICVHESEQHTLGALVMGDMLRRQGHSLKIKLDAKFSEICSLQNSNDYDAIFFSCASFLSVKETAACVREIRQTLRANCPIFLGGGNIEQVSQGLELKDFDLVTSSLDTTIEYVEKQRKKEPLGLLGAY
jgi:methanogenic corrinoid protein MtbC1